MPKLPSVQDDVDYMLQATGDVDALFWATPPGYGSDDVRAFQNRLATAASTASRANEIPRVVNLSSIGAISLPASGRSTDCTTSNAVSTKRPRTSRT